MSAQPGDWICPFCNGRGGHLVTCKPPSGRCRRCTFPIDEHEGVDTPNLKCPKRSVPA